MKAISSWLPWKGKDKVEEKVQKHQRNIKRAKNDSMIVMVGPSGVGRLSASLMSTQKRYLAVY